MHGQQQHEYQFSCGDRVSAECGVLACFAEESRRHRSCFHSLAASGISIIGFCFFSTSIAAVLVSATRTNTGGGVGVV